MIDRIMLEVKNHFARSVESQAFEIVTDGVIGNFSEKYIAGMYIWIKGSFINDGVYKLTGATSSKLTVEDGTLQAENLGDTFLVFGCTPSKTFLGLVTEIENYVSNNGSTTGVAAERIDDYSINFKAGDGTWKNVFASQLNAYRKMFDDDRSFKISKLNWQNKDCGCC